MKDEKEFKGLIQMGAHGKIVIDGVEYINLYPFWAIPIRKVVKFVQKTLWLVGIAIHDPVFNECTPDFNCCCKHVGRKKIVSIGLDL